MPERKIGKCKDNAREIWSGDGSVCFIVEVHCKKGKIKIGTKRGKQKKHVDEGELKACERKTLTCRLTSIWVHGGEDENVVEWTTTPAVAFRSESQNFQEIVSERNVPKLVKQGWIYVGRLAPNKAVVQRTFNV